MSVEVLGLAFIYFIAHSPSAKRASLNCLFNDVQKIEGWPVDVVCLELQNANKLAFSVSVSCVFVVCRSSVVCFVGRGGLALRRFCSQSREPGFESSCCRFEALAMFSSHVATIHSCIN